MVDLCDDKKGDIRDYILMLFFHLLVFLLLLFVQFVMNEGAEVEEDEFVVKTRLVVFCRGRGRG